MCHKTWLVTQFSQTRQYIIRDNFISGPNKMKKENWENTEISDRVHP